MSKASFQVWNTQNFEHSEEFNVLSLSGSLDSSDIFLGAGLTNDVMKSKDLVTAHHV